MPIAQGINKLTVFKVQSTLGTPAVGAGGRVLRRRTSVAASKRATYENDEIVQHQQSTGVNLGTASTEWNFDGLLSPGTYSEFFAAMTRRAWAITAPITVIATVTIAGSAAAWTLTRNAGDFLTGGIKIGDVIRLTAGTFASPVNRDNNILVTGVTATVITGVTLNGSLLVAEAGTSVTVSVIGKKTIAPQTGHTDLLFTVEEWYPDVPASELFPDLRIASIDVGLPATGNATVKLASQGLGVRTNATVQALTSPTAATTSAVLTAVRGLLRVGNAATTVVTGVQVMLKTDLSVLGPIVGSNFSPDMSRGRIQVSGQITGLFDSTTLRNMFDNETLTSLVVVVATDVTNTADFVALGMSALKFTDATPDDGEKGIIRTYPFTAQLNATGGAAFANDQTILTVQDSLA